MAVDKLGGGRRLSLSLSRFGGKWNLATFVHLPAVCPLFRTRRVSLIALFFAITKDYL